MGESVRETIDRLQAQACAFEAVSAKYKDVAWGDVPGLKGRGLVSELALADAEHLHFAAYDGGVVVVPYTVVGDMRVFALRNTWSFYAIDEAMKALRRDNTPAYAALLAVVKSRA